VNVRRARTLMVAMAAACCLCGLLGGGSAAAARGHGRVQEHAASVRRRSKRRPPVVDVARGKRPAVLQPMYVFDGVRVPDGACAIRVDGRVQVWPCNAPVVGRYKRQEAGMRARVERLLRVLESVGVFVGIGLTYWAWRRWVVWRLRQFL
jgi:hypothetical protein